VQPLPSISGSTNGATASGVFPGVQTNGEPMSENTAKVAYNHAGHLPARRKMMQAGAAHLDA